MRVLGPVLGLFMAWILGDWFGWREGGFLALGAVMGGVAAHLHRRVSQLQGQLAQVQQQLVTLVGGTAPAATAAARPATSPSAAGMSPAARAAPPAALAEATVRQFAAVLAPPDAQPTPVVSLNDEDRAAPLSELPETPPAAAPLKTTAHTPPPASARPADLEPDERSLAVTSSLGASVLAWFRGGNTIVRVGVLVLLVGVGLLLRYAAEHAVIPLPWRLAGSALGGLGLTALGLRLTPQRRGYGLSLQGAGVGIAYMSLFAAFRLYGLMPAGLSFGLMALLCAAITALALKQDALPLAALGFGGAFLAPVLVSTGQGSHVALLSYYLLLNVSIAVIARRKPWTLLHLEGFAFTLGIASAWGFSAYRPELFASTEPFLIAHFLLYLYIGVQYTLHMIERSPPRQDLALVDGSLVFGTPIAAFGLQAALLRQQPLALAFSAAVLSGLYLVLGRALLRRAGSRVLLLVESTLALGLAFLALVTPLALDARWTSAAWALQGAGVLWIALRQQRRWAAAMGLLLQALACLAYWSHQAGLPGAPGGWLFLNSAWLGLGLLVLALMFSSHTLQRQPRDSAMAQAFAEPVMSWMLLAGALLQLWAGGMAELGQWDQARYREALLAAGWSALLAVAGEGLRRRLRWPALGLAAQGLAGLGLLLGIGALLLALTRIVGSAETLLLRQGGLDIALLGLLATGWLLRRQDLDAQAPPPASRQLLLTLGSWHLLLHAGALPYALAVAYIGRHEAWTPAALMLLPTLIALALMSPRLAPRWPVRHHRDWLRQTVLRPWLAVLAGWSLLANGVGNGRMDPLPSLPLLNPLDLAHGLALLYALRLGRGEPEGRLGSAWLRGGVALAFFWLNSLLVRTLHQWAGTPLWLDGALGSSLVQTGLSLLWTLSALATMGWATRRAPARLARGAWMVGAGLLGVVVLKLFLLDLAMLNSLMRIASFLVVGLLMLVIGYVAPLPPAAGGVDAKAGA
ncbi:DUF2339 domain-containing protein [Mitsuaria sp. WAJ17]|uniref:DUF2339 domain-containing protein n=1 Tax=Mitsuaria sp. WAJ17 TaxID=2761452 RepID=UPI0015FECA47|nr:DUF2339 domain-containing protein [Mitsuaria sp. WAJ17]MBB2487347.1 DUF2339 domain-containing protein [Mitsuaria sp. WAJ17]